MANRITIPALPRPSLPDTPKRVAAAGRGIVSWRPPRGNDRRLLLFRIAWSPLWLGSDVPPPRPRGMETALSSGGMVGDYFAGELSKLTRRIWLQQTLNIIGRALWLPLFVACAWLGVELLGGPVLEPIAIAALWVVTIPLGAHFSTMVRPSRRRVARMLDRSFALQERMVTALDNLGRDVPAAGESPAIAYLQMADAANVISDLKTHPAFRLRPPVREIVVTIVCVLTLCALFFLRGVGDGLPALSVNPIPPFVPAAERLARQPAPQPQTGVVQADAPTREEVQEMAQRSSQAQQDLKLLGDALSDQAVTRAAAEAIERGDYAAAADLIRQAAENADQLSPAAREGLADDLDAAADQMSPGQNGLADATRNAAAGLRAGGDEAKAGMSELGDEVDSASSDIVSQEELASQMSRAEAAEASQSGGEQSGSSSNNEGESGDSSAEGGDSQSGDSQEGASGLPSSSSASNPDEETDGGSDGDPSDPGDPSGERDPGGSSAEGDAEGGAPQPGSDGATDAETGSDQPGDGQSPADGMPEGNPGGRQGPDDGSGAQAGGAGSGASPDQESPDAGSGSTGGESGTGTPSEPDVEESGSAAGQDAGAEEDPRASITLSRSPEGEGIQTGGQGNSASVGSGGGASIGSGVTVQGEIGDAGPDSNHVPSEYRGIVEDFFSDQDGS